MARKRSRSKGAKSSSAIPPSPPVARAAGYVVVRRKSDGVVGSLQFQHDPRLYFGFVAD